MQSMTSTSHNAAQKVIHQRIIDLRVAEERAKEERGAALERIRTERERLTRRLGELDREEKVDFEGGGELRELLDFSASMGWGVPDVDIALERLVQEAEADEEFDDEYTEEKFRRVYAANREVVLAERHSSSQMAKVFELMDAEDS